MYIKDIENLLDLLKNSFLTCTRVSVTNRLSLFFLNKLQISELMKFHVTYLMHDRFIKIAILTSGASLPRDSLLNVLNRSTGRHNAYLQKNLKPFGLSTPTHGRQWLLVATTKQQDVAGTMKASCGWKRTEGTQGACCSDETTVCCCCFCDSGWFDWERKRANYVWIAATVHGGLRGNKKKLNCDRVTGNSLFRREIRPNLHWNTTKTLAGTFTHDLVPVLVGSERFYHRKATKTIWATNSDVFHFQTKTQFRRQRESRRESGGQKTVRKCILVLVNERTREEDFDLSEFGRVSSQQLSGFNFWFNFYEAIR